MQTVLTRSSRVVQLALTCALLVTLGTANARTLAEIQQSGTLRICVAGSSAPFYQANGEALANFLELKPQTIQLKEWDLQFQNQSGVLVKEASYVAKLLADGSCDVFPNDLHVLDWRATKMDLVPYYRTRKVIIARRGERNLQSVEDLAGRRAAVQKGTAYDSWLLEQNKTLFTNKPVLISYMPTADAIAAVSAQSADFTVLGAESSFKWVRGDLDNLDILFAVDVPVSVAWGVHPQAGALRSRIEQFFKANARVGSNLDNSWRKQYGISLMEYQLFEAAYQSEGLNFKQLLAWMIPVGAGLLGALLTVALWTGRLKREVRERTAAELRSEENARLLTERDHLSSQIATILTELQGVRNFAELTQTLFASTAPLLALGQASMYRLDADRNVLLLCGGYARVGKATPGTEVAVGVGLAGQCALESKTFVVNDPPTDYLQLGSGLGALPAKSIVLIPILNKRVLLGVIELACMTPYDEQSQSLIDRLMPVIAMSLEILGRNEQAQRLLESTQEQAVALDKQRDEIKQLLEEQEAIFQNAPHGIVYVGDGKMLRANGQMARYFDSAVDDLVGKPLQTIFSSDENFQDFQTRVQPILAAGQVAHLEWQFVKKDGSPFFAMLSGQGAALTGNTHAAIWMFEDITGRKSVEAELHASQERLSLAISGSGDAMFSFDVRTGENWFSPRFFELLGYGVGDLPNTLQTWRDHLHPDDVNPAAQAFAAHLQSDVPYDVEYRLRTKQAGYRWFRARAESLRDSDGKAYRVSGTISDISERKEVELRLIASEHQMRFMLETSPAAVRVTSSANLTVVFANPAYAKLLHIGVESVVGSEFMSFYQNPEESASISARLRRGEDIVNLPVRLKTVDGKPLEVLGSYLHIQYDGEPCVLGWFIDVTELRSAREMAGKTST